MDYIKSSKAEMVKIMSKWARCLECNQEFKKKGNQVFCQSRCRIKRNNIRKYGTPYKPKSKKSLKRSQEEVSKIAVCNGLTPITITVYCSKFHKNTEKQDGLGWVKDLTIGNVDEMKQPK